MSASQGDKFQKDIFRSPIDFPIQLSGNFGDFRTNHFHSGIDIRTQGAIGKNIYAVSAGYISRIRISPFGYGNALYITHPSGHTTLYGHLRSFDKRTQEYIKDKQYKFELNTIDHSLEAGEIEVNKGDIIAKSGNSGSSSGPHLHFEIRDSATEHPLNPLFFGFEIPDNVKPEIYGVYIYPFEEWSTINGEAREGYFRALKTKNGLGIAGRIAVSGRIGIGLDALDKFTNGKFKHTFNALTLKVNGETKYQFKYDELDFITLRDVNSHMDHAKKIREKKKITKCFKDAHNRLDIYDVNENNGILELFPGDLAQIELTIRDASNNESRITFEMYGEENELREVIRAEYDKTLFAEKENAYHTDEASLYFPEGRLYSDVRMKIDKVNAEDISMGFCIEPKYTPLKDWYTLKVKCELPPNVDPKKMILLKERAKGRLKPLYSKFENGWISCRTKEFGNYRIGVDSIAPSIKLLSKNLSNNALSFGITDNFDQFESYEARIDGRWLKLFLDQKAKKIHCDPRDLELEKGKHNFELWILDAQGNKGVFQREFRI